jgi:hypothetical protein
MTAVGRKSFEIYVEEMKKMVRLIDKIEKV